MRSHTYLLAGLLLLVPFAGLRAQPAAPTPEQLARLRAMAAAGPHRAALALPPLSVDIASREEVRQFYRAVYAASDGIDMGWTGSYATGTAGDTSAAFKDAVLLRTNFFRALVGVPAAVTLNSTFSAKAQQAALMMSANNALTHFPPPSWTFYTADGREAAENSNIAIGYSGPGAVTGYMSDGGSNNAAVGHRRWLIYPQMQQIGTGDVPGSATLLPANAIWVFDGNFGTPRPATRTTAVPYPPAGYVPHQLVWPRWSFTYPEADFAGTTVAMTRNGQSVPVVLEPLSSGVGEPTLVWVYDGLDSNEDTEHPRPAADTTYTVNVNNVRIGGVSQSFSYNVTVFDPDVAGGDFVATTIAGTATPAVGGANAYTASKPAFAAGFDWRALQFATFGKTYGAESGLDGIAASTSGGYSVVQGVSVGAGTAAFHLAHDVRTDQVLTLPETFHVASDAAAVSFLSRLGWATDVQVARVQVSVDDGNSWSDVYTQPGSGGSGETGFTPRTASLAAYAGQTIRLRFNYTVSSAGSAYPQTDNDVGWVVDNVTLSGVQTATVVTTTSVPTGTSFTYSPASAGEFGLQARGVLFDAFPLQWGPVKLVAATAGPVFTSHPQNRAAAVGGSVTLSAAATGATYQWQHNGSALAGSTGANLTLGDLQPDDTGLYAAVASTGGFSTTSLPGIVGLTTTAKIVGLGQEFPNILHGGTGFTYDQILLGGPAATITADSALNQITRMSYIDLSNDIVQIEYSGPGSVSVVLEGSSGPAIPLNYLQNVSYMKGHAAIVVTGATENSHLSVFSVGRGNAANQGLFDNAIDYDGLADIAFIAIQSSDGKFGGLRTANASYWNTKGFTGVYAPGVQFTGPVFVHDIEARDTATPVLMVGSATDARITGGDLAQSNGRAVMVSGLAQLRMAAGTTSHYVVSAPVAAEFLNARTNQGRLEENGVDITATVIINP